MTIALPKQRMKVPEFLAWAEAQPQGRYELVNGEVVVMAPERVRHNLVKTAVFRALDNAVRAARLPCTVFTDGVGIVINENTVREPDASVQCGGELNLDSMTLDAPLIVVEVASPSSERHDTHAERRNIAQCKAHHRPGHAPAEAQRDQKDSSPDGVRRRWCPGGRICGHICALLCLGG